jgi:cation/acetate symporter
MIYGFSKEAFIVFLFFVGVVLGLSFYFGAKAKSAKGYFAAHGEISWFVNGVAFAGDYLSAASFLGICGSIAFYGYDGFLYSIGFLAGWMVALFVIAEPIKRLGRYTFADALDKKYNSRGVKLTAAIATLVVSIFYLIPQMVGAGALIRPLLGLPYQVGVVLVGVVVIIIVVSAGMVSTTWVQFIKGSLLVVFCTLLTILILYRGFSTSSGTHEFRRMPAADLQYATGITLLPEEGAWKGKPYVRTSDTFGVVTVWRKQGSDLFEAQTKTTKNGVVLVNGKPQGKHPGEPDLYPVGTFSKLPDGAQKTGPLGPFEFFSKLKDSEVTLWGNEKIKNADGSETTIYYQKPTKGMDVLMPGGSPTFKGIKSAKLTDKLDFFSLMLALFLGTASLPHILIRYYTVRNQASARKSTVVGIASIGFFYILTLYLGLGAMGSGTLDVTDTNMAAPLLAKSFSPLLFAIISAIAFTTVLGTVSGLILAASGAIAHDLMTNVFKLDLNEREQVRVAKIAAVVVGGLAMLLGVANQKMNVAFLVAWAFNVAASANLPALVMVLFWKRTTKRGVTAAIAVGLASSVAWLMLSEPAYKNVYGLSTPGVVPFSQPGLVTIPLGFLVLIVVSLMTSNGARVATDPARAEAGVASS